MGGRGTVDYDLKPEEISQIQTRLLGWYRENKRDLPWRKAAQSQNQQQHAYAVWVSEIMLQQTRVATVIKFYDRWMQCWPTVNDLSEASLEQVNEVWAGLGYYSRGRRLLEGAVKVVEKLNGKIPENADGLMKEIPGVGRYTAAAIASIAFGEAVGVVDGNVIRVICRLLTIGGDSSAKNVLDFIWKQVNQLIPGESAGDFNQAMMELGALVCMPTSPACQQCPLQSVCRAYRETQEQKSKNSILNCTNHQNEKAHKRKSSGGPKGPAKRQKTDRETEVDIESCADFLGFAPDQPWVPTLGVTNYPRKPKKKPPRNETALITVIEWQNGSLEDSKVKIKPGDAAYGMKCLLTQRPSSGLLAGLWEFPTLTLTNEDMACPTFKKLLAKKGSQPSKSSSKYISKMMDQMLQKRLGNMTISHREHVGEYVHVFSHIHLRYIIERMAVTSSCSVKNEKDTPIVISEHECVDSDKKPSSWRWINKDKLHEYAVSSAMHKIMKICDNRTVNAKNDNQVKLTKFFSPSLK